MAQNNQQVRETLKQKNEQISLRGESNHLKENQMHKISCDSLLCKLLQPQNRFKMTFFAHF